MRTYHCANKIRSILNINMAITLIILLLVIQIKGQHPSFEDFNTKEDYHEPEKETILSNLVEHNHEDKDFNLLYAQVFLLVGFIFITILVLILGICTYILCCHSQTRRSCIKTPYSAFDDNEIIQNNDIRESEKKLQRIFEDQENALKTPTKRERHTRVSPELKESVCNSEARFLTEG